MPAASRREFLSALGRGMIVARIGSTVAMDLGLTPAIAAEAPDELSFGEQEPLVDFLQETPVAQLLPQVVEKLRTGTSLKDFVAAAALANARAFGGEDYIGFHTLMALGPAFAMSQQLPSERAALPVLKVLYRNSARMQQLGGAKAQTLRPVEPSAAPGGAETAELIRSLVRKGDLKTAEATLAGVAAQSPDAAFNDLMHTLEDGAEVHRVVLMQRAWDMLALAGQEQALTMLRQSLHYCVKNEEHSAQRFSGIRELLPKLLEQHKLLGRSPGTRTADDAWLNQMVETLFTANADQAAEAVAAALAEDFSPAAIAEAVSLAANQLVLRDAGRTGKQVQDGKPEGSVHGDSIGVHACDSAGAWRDIARVSNARNTLAATILAGYQVALDRTNRGGNFQTWQPRPHVEVLANVTAKEAKALLDKLDGAIRENDQEMACALTHRYCELGHSERGAFDVLLKYATSEDGALHAEKFYRTVSADYSLTRPAYRSRHLVALSRVTASEYGRTAAGYKEACDLLGVS